MYRCMRCRGVAGPRSKVKTTCQKWSANFRPKCGLKLAKLGKLVELTVERAPRPAWAGQLWAGAGAWRRRAHLCGL